MRSWKPGIRLQLFRLNCDWPGENRIREGEVTSQGQSPPSWHWLLSLGVTLRSTSDYVSDLPTATQPTPLGSSFLLCREDNAIWAAHSNSKIGYSGVKELELAYIRMSKLQVLLQLN